MLRAKYTIWAFYIHCPDILYNALRVLGNIENGLDDLTNNDKLSNTIVKLLSKNYIICH